MAEVGEALAETAQDDSDPVGDFTTPPTSSAKVHDLSEYLWRHESEEFEDCLDALARARSRAHLILALGGLRPCAAAHGD